MFGVGGGILFVPTLIALGLGQVEAQATSLAAILPTVAAGTWRQAVVRKRALEARARARADLGRGRPGGSPGRALTARGRAQAPVRRPPDRGRRANSLAGAQPIGHPSTMSTRTTSGSRSSTSRSAASSSGSSARTRRSGSSSSRRTGCSRSARSRTSASASCSASCSSTTTCRPTTGRRRGSTCS